MIFFSFSFLFFLLQFVLRLGSDTPDSFHFQFILGASLILGYFLLLFKKDSPFSVKFEFSPANIFFALFLVFVIFQFLKSFYSQALQGQENVSGLSQISLDSLLERVFFVAFFFLSAQFFKRKSVVLQMANAMALVAFFVALNAIPNLLAGKFFYLNKAGKQVFFYPIFYFHKWIGQYILGRYSSSNRTGDVIAFGFFLALGVAVYFFQLWHEAKRGENDTDIKQSVPFPFILLRLTFAMVIGGAVLLFFSRGTTSFFLLALVFYFLILSVRFFSKYRLILGSVILFMTVSLCWAGNFPKLWKEIQTLRIEKEALHNDRATDEHRSKSLYTNIEGSKRALKIYHENPIWGAGMDHYSMISSKYATPGIKDDYVDYFVLSHYLQQLAELGVGAYIYFLFLLAYFGQVLVGLFLTKSSFKFIMALSLVMPVFVALGHASINDLMEHFSMAMLVYMSMGASLGILRKDFEHTA